MEKSDIKRTSSVDFLNALKKFNEKLWLDRNIASVELGSIIEEFEENINAETDYRNKCRNAALEKINKNSEEYEEEVTGLKAERKALLEDVVKLESELHQYKEQVAELKVEIYAKNEEYSKLKIGVAGEKETLDEDYSLKVTMLYEELSKKNRVLLDKWVKKNENLKLEIAEVKREYEGRFKSLDEKERKLESDFDIRNSNLNSKIESVMKKYEDRVKSLDEKEKALKKNFNSQKTELVKTFDRVRLDFEEREKNLKRVRVNK